MIRSLASGRPGAPVMDCGAQRIEAKFRFPRRRREPTGRGPWPARLSLLGSSGAWGRCLSHRTGQTQSAIPSPLSSRDRRCRAVHPPAPSGRPAQRPLWSCPGSANPRRTGERPPTCSNQVGPARCTARFAPAGGHGVAKVDCAYLVDPANLAHVGPETLLAGSTEILTAACVPLLRPAGQWYEYDQFYP